MNPMATNSTGDAFVLVWNHDDRALVQHSHHHK
jgi:hypothetical protein